MAGNAQLPLLGVIICCTSIPPEQRSHLASIAEQMGALHKFDLTSDVTHLIVGDYDTPKYKFVAKERQDVKALLPSWIEALRSSWLEGGATDVEALEVAHTLPTYHGLRLCVTGFEDLTYRKTLEDQIQQAGGSYFGNLTKDITHLIAKKPAGEKYEYAKKHREMKVVSVEWHEHSLDRGMILDEASYDPLLPVEERGRGAWIRRATSTTSLGKRPRVNDSGSQNARKLRRTASAKFETHNDSLWTDIVGAEIKVEKKNAEDWDVAPHAVSDERADDRPLGPVDAKFKSLKTEEESKALRRSQSLGSLESLLGKAAQKQGLFHGKTFLLQNFDEKKTAILERHLQSHGALLVNNTEHLPLHNGYLLVSHTSPRQDAQGVLISPENIPQLVTDLWVERCIHAKCLVDPEKHITSTPFDRFPIAGFEHLNVSSTGFQGVDLLHASRVVTLMGAAYHEYFTDKVNVLICNSVLPGHDKLRHAQLWRVPAVKPEWLWDCVRKGEKVKFGDYLVQPISVEPCSNEGSGSTKATETAAVPCKRGVMAAARDVDIPSRKILPVGGSYKQPKKPRRAPRPFGSPGKTAESSFPDDAGPILGDSGALLDNELMNDAPQDEAPHMPISKPVMASLASPSTSKPLPLHEITPNSSPPKPQSLVDIQQCKPSENDIPPSQEEDGNDDDTLGPAISSLLSHHRAQRSSSTTTKLDTSTKVATSPNHDAPYSRRNRRQLLGRAPSNISHNNSINLSRASSVDTMNMDGACTPLSATHQSLLAASTTNKDNTHSSKTELQAIYDGHHDDPDKPVEDHLQMTQLGYEDPNVAAWRERVAYKMAGGKVKGGTTPGKEKKRIETPGKKGRVAEVGLGISSRTRMAGGGGGKS